MLLHKSCNIICLRSSTLHQMTSFCSHNTLREHLQTDFAMLNVIMTLGGRGLAPWRYKFIQLAIVSNSQELYFNKDCSSNTAWTARIQGKNTCFKHIQTHNFISKQTLFHNFILHKFSFNCGFCLHSYKRFNCGLWFISNVLVPQLYIGNLLIKGSSPL